MKNEIKRNIIEEGHFTEATYPFTIKSNYSTLGSFTEVSSNITSSQIVSTLDNSVRDLLGFKPVVLHEEYNLSVYPVEILLSDNIFLECDF